LDAARRRLLPLIAARRATVRSKGAIADASIRGDVGSAL